MRARRSSIRPLELLPSLLAPRSVVPLYLDPRTRTRRRAAVFGCGARAFCGLRCDGVTRGPAGASAGRRGGPKGWERLARLSGPRLKAGAACASPALRGRRGELLSAQISCAAPGGFVQGGTGASTSRLGKKRVLLRVREASLPISRSRPTGSLRSCRSSYFGWPGLVQKTRRDCQKAPRESA